MRFQADLLLLRIRYSLQTRALGTRHSHSIQKRNQYALHFPVILFYTTLNILTPQCGIVNGMLTP